MLETSAAVPLERILTTVRSIWGFDELRPLQEKAIRAVLEGRDSVVVFPTGGGKSLCYQVPPIVSGHISVVVSPLISLMKDQVDGLRLRGYPAIGVHSSLSSKEREQNAREVRDGRCRLMFVSPERLLMPDFLRFVERLGVCAFAIDEAHCISQWGHAFRPEYRRLGLLKKHFPKASLHAYTATATPRVRDDIAGQLNLSEPEVLVGSVDRPNLTYRVVQRVDSRAQVFDVVRRHRGEGGIVYCQSRRETESMAESLKLAGVDAAAYHAGLSAEARRRVQDGFAIESLNVVTATVAFGMGIDRSNVRFVIHAAMPQSIEHYQQESGRAGRDGLEAECVLLYSAGDLVRWRSLIQKQQDESNGSQQDTAVSLALLNQVQNYAGSATCRHRTLVAHFGQAYDRANCGACDVCLDEVEWMDDSDVIAQKIVSCVARVERHSGISFGVRHIADVLAGADTAMIRKHRHERVSTYGLLRGTLKKHLTSWINQLLDQGILARTPGDIPTLTLTALSWELMRGERSVRLRRVGSEKRRISAAEAESWEGVSRALFEHLRRVRRELAEASGVPAFVVFSDRTLRDMARRRPTTPDAFREVHGVGEMKLNQFGQRFSAEIEAFIDTNGGDTNQAVEKV